MILGLKKWYFYVKTVDFRPKNNTCIRLVLLVCSTGDVQVYKRLYNTCPVFKNESRKMDTCTCPVFVLP